MAVAETQGIPGGKSGSLVPFIVVLLVLTLVAGGGGWFMGKSLPIAGHAAHATKPANPADAPQNVDPATSVAGAGPVVKLEPILVTLSAPSNVWVRAEISLVAKRGAAISPDLAATIQGDFAAYFSALSLPQLAGASGLQYLREDLEERAKMRSDGRVAAVIISSLVME